MEMGNSGIRIITAITISGCSLLFLAFLKNVYTDSSQPTQDQQTDDNPTPKRSVSSGKKKVRFSEEVEEPSSNNVEYRRRRGGQKATIGKREGREGRREKRIVELPANRNALYSGIYRYRLQMSTLMIYG